MAVRYFTDDCTYRLPQKRLTARWLHEVAAGEGYALGDVTYIFCSAQRLLEMNRQYLGHDYFTDVITLTAEPMVPICAFLATFWPFSTQIVPMLA